MKLNHLFDYSKLERETLDSGVRHYIQPNGHKVPSVTTILAATSNNTGLKQWQEWVGLEEATRVRTEAAGLGSLVHDHLEKYIQGIDRPTGNNVVRLLAKNMADQIIGQGLINVNEFWGNEVALYYPDLYAGTTDGVGTVCGIATIDDGTPCIIDFKTTNKMKRREDIGDYFLQLVAYQIAHDVLYDTKITAGIIFMVDRSLKFKRFILQGDDFINCQKTWLVRLGDYYTHVASK